MRNRPPNSPNPLVFNPTDKCPAFVVNPKIARRALEKQRADELEYAQLLEDNVPAAPIYSGLDGGMNKVFLARFPGRVTLSKRLGLDLVQGELVGELMSMNISYAKRFENFYYRPGTKWAYVIMFDPSQEKKNYGERDERADYFYEAVASSKGMVSTTPGIGQAYQVDLNAVLDQVDIDRLLDRIDIDRLWTGSTRRLLARMDLDDLVRRIDFDALVEQTDLGAVIAASSSGAASDVLWA